MKKQPCKNPNCHRIVCLTSKSGYCRYCVRQKKETEAKRFLKRTDGINPGKTYQEYIEESKKHWEYVRKYSFGNYSLK